MTILIYLYTDRRHLVPDYCIEKPVTFTTFQLARRYKNKCRMISPFLKPQNLNAMNVNDLYHTQANFN